MMSLEQQFCMALYEFILGYHTQKPNYQELQEIIKGLTYLTITDTTLRTDYECLQKEDCNISGEDLLKHRSTKVLSVFLIVNKEILPTNKIYKRYSKDGKQILTNGSYAKVLFEAYKKYCPKQLQENYPINWDSILKICKDRLLALAVEPNEKKFPPTVPKNAHSKTQVDDNQNDTKQPNNLTPQKPPYCNKLPFSNQNLLKEIKTLFETNTFLTIQGITGLGKSIFAYSYFLKYDETHYTHKAWVFVRYGEIDFSLAECFLEDVDLLTNLGVPVEWNKDAKWLSVKDKLLKLKGDNLLVLDNADKDLSGEAEFWKHLANTGNWKVLLTSQIPHSNFGNYMLTPNKEDTDIKLGGEIHPTPRSLLERFEKYELKPITQTRVLETGFESKTLLEFIEQVFEVSNLTEDEQALLVQLSVLKSIPITYQDICFLLHQEADNVDFVNRIKGLIRKSWLYQDTNQSIYMQVGAQRFIQQKLKTNAINCEKVIHAFTERLNLLFKEQSYQDFSYRRFSSHLEHLLSVNIEIEERILAKLYHQLAVFLVQLTKLEEAKKWEMKAIEIAVKPQFSDDIAFLGACYLIMAGIYDGLGLAKIAVLFQLNAIEIYEKPSLKAYHELAVSYNNFALMLNRLSNYNEAISYIKKSLKTQRNFEKEDLKLKSLSYSNLSLIYKDLGKYEEALEWQRKCIDLRRIYLPLEHPHFAISYDALSSIHYELNKYDEALEWAEKAIEIAEKPPVLPPLP